MEKQLGSLPVIADFSRVALIANRLTRPQAMAGVAGSAALAIAVAEALRRYPGVRVVGIAGGLALELLRATAHLDPGNVVVAEPGAVPAPIAGDRDAVCVGSRWAEEFAAIQGGPLVRPRPWGRPAGGGVAAGQGPTAPDVAGGPPAWTLAPQLGDTAGITQPTPGVVQIPCANRAEICT